MVFLRIFIPVTFLLGLLNCSAPEHNSDKLFSSITSYQSGVSFENTLSEDENMNLLVYEYFYNGAGVAVGDLNGDELPDIFFTANMAANKLYLNKGAFSFEDVTEAAGLSDERPWKTGVNLIDINEDGKLDIYVCRSGALPAPQRRNQLFVNQGNDESGVPSFIEAASLYNLALPSFSNQIHFLDYDRDGDNDALLLNHNEAAMPVLNPAQARKILAKSDPDRGLRLLQNRDGKFYDVTDESGINGSSLSYGLGLAIADFNRDGFPDFYVGNDYEAPDYLYYNNGDGTFADRLGEQMGHTSHFSMGADAGDINNDGWPDLVSLDMLPEDNERRKLLLPDDNRSKLDFSLAVGFHHQTMRNMLHLNRGDGSFAEIGQLAGIDATDWSWAPLLADFDNDGALDLHVTNGYNKDFTNQDFTKYMRDYINERKNFSKKDLRPLIEAMPASDVNNYAFRGIGDGTFTDMTTDWGMARPSNSNGAASADLDGDGDLDLLINNVNGPALLYRNNGTDNHWLGVRLAAGGSASAAIGTVVEIMMDSLTLRRRYQPARGYQSAAAVPLHFGLGARTPTEYGASAQVQSITVRWPDGSTERFAVPAVDRYLTLQKGNGAVVETVEQSPKPLFIPTEAPFAYLDEESTRRDFDNEPLLPRAYTDSRSVLRQAGISELDRYFGAKGMLFAGKTGLSVVPNDYQPGRYPLTEPLEVALSVDGKLTGLSLEDLPESLRGIGRINAVASADLTGDGQEELLLAGEWSRVMAFSLAEGNLQEIDILPRHFGWWNTLLVADWNKDGKPDILAGNEGLNNDLNVSPTTPVELHAADLDGNGTIDPILSAYGPDGKRYPDATRDELVGQLAGLRKRYPNYQSYATETLDDVFPQWPAATIHLTANHLATTLYLSQPDGSYAVAPLPQEAQYAPIHAAVTLDVDGDGHLDVVLACV